MRRVVTLAPPGAPMFELGMPARLFGAARDQHGAALYEVETVSMDGTGSLLTADGLRLTTSKGFTAVAEADIVVVASSDDLLDADRVRVLAAGLRGVLLRQGEPRPGQRI